MEPYKLHMKIGPHEFSAEGNQETVTKQFEDFKRLIGDRNLQIDQIQGKAIFHYDTDNKMVTLKERPPQGPRYIADSIILILLGYKTFRHEEYVFATQTKKSLQHSGINVNRMDRELKDDINNGSIIKIGRKKGATYKLSTRGILKAQEIVENILTEKR